MQPYLPAVSSFEIDKDDLLYLACALKEDTFIWSNDKELKNQKRIKLRTTIELIEEFGAL